jgi:hypothetical protein
MAMQVTQDAIAVRIGLFSGRPNPEMTLSGDDAARFAELVQSTVGGEPIHPPPAPRLGQFYGFLVLAPAPLARTLGLPPQMSIFAGVLTEMRDRSQVHWRDVGGVERFLVRLAYEQGFGDELRRAGVAEQR